MRAIVKPLWYCTRVVTCRLDHMIDLAAMEAFDEGRGKIPDESKMLTDYNGLKASEFAKQYPQIATLPKKLFVGLVIGEGIESIDQHYKTTNSVSHKAGRPLGNIAGGGLKLYQQIQLCV